MAQTTTTSSAAPGMFVRPFGLTRCVEPDPTATLDISGITYDGGTQMSMRGGRPLVDQPLLGTAVQCTVTTREDMQAWTDKVSD